ncbi:hypothetical protein [Pleurocapsa sp. FMAR1]|uniref:hypothetical protein n=1 Tax=Pleurocapsa sp. FMAR1 TaxID=3040204 RepID=UPI0029C92249|nr:hypothetical protein [Pleurocapsa sp. FMAR1]
MDNNSSLDLMEICAASDNTRVRYFIADNPSATVTILSKLAFDKDRMIRQQVANNSNTPNYIIEHLAKEGIQKCNDIPF